MSVTYFSIRVTVVYCTITNSCILTQCVSYISGDETTFPRLAHSNKITRKMYVRLIYVSPRIDKFLSDIRNVLKVYKLYIF